MAKKPAATAKPDTETTIENGPEAEAPATSSVLPAPGNEGAQTEAAGAETALAAEGRRGPPGKTVVVIGPQKGRWRIGRHFSQEPVSIPAQDMIDAEFAALMADPELAVSIVDAPY